MLNRTAAVAWACAVIAIAWCGTSQAWAGYFYVTLAPDNGAGSGAIAKVNMDGSASVFVPSGSTGLTDPYAEAVDSQGNLYVADDDPDDEAIWKVTPTGVASQFATGVSYAAGLAFDDAGNLYVSNDGNDADPTNHAKILKFDAHGASLGAFSTSDDLASPDQLAYRAGTLYECNWSSGEVLKFDTATGAESVFASGLGTPDGIAIDSSGNVYVADYDNDDVTKFAPDGTNLGTFASNVYGAAGMTFDDQGNLYVVDSVDYDVDKIAPDGTLTTDFYHATNYDDYINTIVFVPEPASGALALLGLAGAALLVRRRPTSDISH